MMRPYLLATCLVVTLAAVPARADSLPEALASAYATNPDIAAARASLRAVDESLPIATSGTRPTVSLSGSFSQELSKRFGDEGQYWNGGISLQQPIWEGGRVRASISSAKARILAARERLRAAEYRLIVDTVSAYADVLRTQQEVRLNKNQVHVLSEQLRASQDRFEVGDLTRTDVAQSEARLERARSALVSAEANLTLVAQAYQRLVGRAPADLAPLPPLPPLPESESEAVRLATAGNPLLNAARLDEESAKAIVRQVKAQRLPSVSVTAGVGYTHYNGNLMPRAATGFDPTLGVQATMPIFTGGRLAAQVRQAQAEQAAQIATIANVERLTIESASSQWALMKASESTIASARTTVEANELASEGVKRENEVGSRTILDVLNAEQELLNSQVDLVRAERNRYVAAYALLESIGDPDVALAGVPVERYDAAANAARVSKKGWSEFSHDPDPRTDVTRDNARLIGPQP